MNEKMVNRSWKWIAVILATLLLATLSCIAGMGVGGIFGYNLGKHHAPVLLTPPPQNNVTPGGSPFPHLDEERAWLGVAYQMQDEGALIVEVIPGSPADKAGLRVGDRITAVEGDKVTPDHPLAERILTHRPGETVTLTVERDGRTRKIKVTLGSTIQPPSLPMIPPSSPCCPNHHDG